MSDDFYDIKHDVSGNVYWSTIKPKIDEMAMAFAEKVDAAMLEQPAVTAELNRLGWHKESSGCPCCTMDGKGGVEPFYDDDYTTAIVEAGNAWDIYGPHISVILHDAPWHDLNIPIKCCPACGRKLTQDE